MTKRRSGLVPSNSYLTDAPEVLLAVPATMSVQYGMITLEAVPPGQLPE
jgi:hypothetical protein